MHRVLQQMIRNNACGRARTGRRPVVVTAEEILFSRRVFNQLHDVGHYGASIT